MIEQIAAAVGTELISYFPPKGGIRPILKIVLGQNS